MRPLIGVTTSEVRRAEGVRQTPQGEPPSTEMALGLRYLRAIEAAGGLPVVLPPLELDAVRPLLDHLTGICLSGGPDLDPKSYGEREHPELGPTEPDIDRFELELAKLAWREGLPLLAICRGAQALNVARGGTLVQHLPDEPRVTLEHRQDVPGDQPTHGVEVFEGSLLAEVMGGAGPFEVNSFHHQAAARLGDGLRVVARSTDGVVEAIEAPARPFVLGVQWHAECLAERGEQAALFQGLVGAAAEYTAAGSRFLRAA
jgi:putative glutamine amidotransferase